MRSFLLPFILAALLWSVAPPAQSDTLAPPPGGPTGAPAEAGQAEPATPLEPAPLAVIHEAMGQVFVVKAGDPDSTPAEEDMELGAGDRVTTGSNGSVTISLRDEHFVKLGSLATLTVKELRSDQVAGGIWARLMLARGKMMAAVASLTSADSRFEVDTPTAVAAVKGTSFQVSAESNSTTISVLEGSVATSGFRDDSVAPEELEVKEGYETVVDAKTRRPGSLTKFFNNEKRRKTRVALSEFRAKIQKVRARGKSGELRRQRRLRVLSRAWLIERYRQKNPSSYKSLPAWRRNRLDQFLAGHKPELDANRAEITRYLNSNPKTRKLLENQTSRRFAGARGATNRRSKKHPGGNEQPPAPERRRTRQ